MTKSSWIARLDLRILRKHKWAIALGTVLVTSVALAYVLAATPVYSSTATLLLQSQQASPLSSVEQSASEIEGRDYYLTQYELLKSRQLATRVVKHLGLISQADNTPGPLDAGKRVFTAIMARLGRIFKGTDDATKGESPATDRSAITDPASADAVTSGLEYQPGADSNSDFGGQLAGKQLERAVNRYLSRLKVSPVGTTRLVELSYESADPVLAATVANTVGEQYILSNLDSRMEMALQGSKWMNERLSQLKLTLDGSEQKLVRYKVANNLVGLNGDVDELDETTALLASTELAAEQTGLNELGELYNKVRLLQATAPEQLASIPEVRSDSMVRSVKIEQGQGRRELDDLLNEHDSAHPRVVDAVSRLAALDALMREHTSRIVASIENSYKLARQRVASLQSTLSAGRQELQVSGEQSTELLALVQEVSANRDMYDAFFARVSATRSAERMETPNARISDRAVIAGHPVKPQKQLILGLAALVSLVLLSLLAIVYELMDDTIKGTADVESKLGVRLLGTIPLLKSGILGRRRKVPINPLDIDETHSTFVEAIRTIRTTLRMKPEPDQLNKTILITSSIPGEGKSTASLNIAYAMSRLEKVILIDADMRRPSIARTLKIDQSQPGLSNLISGSASVQDCIKRRLLGDLDVIPCGEIPDFPLELISSSRFAELISKLGDHYDRIIIDSAPTQAVSDALVLGSLADCVVYVVKSHATPYEVVKRGLERLSQMDISVAGVVMTQVDFDKIKAYGGDQYYQGYYDYYGYGNKPKSGKSHTEQPQDDPESALGSSPKPVFVDTGELDFDSVYTRSPDFRRSEAASVSADAHEMQTAAEPAGPSTLTPAEDFLDRLHSQQWAKLNSEEATLDLNAESFTAQGQGVLTSVSETSNGDLGDVALGDNGISVSDMGDSARDEVARDEAEAARDEIERVDIKPKPPRFEEDNFDLV